MPKLKFVSFAVEACSLRIGVRSLKFGGKSLKSAARA